MVRVSSLISDSNDAAAASPIEPDPAPDVRPLLAGLATAAQLSSFADLAAGATLATEPAARVAISRLAAGQFTSVERGVAAITDAGGALDGPVAQVRDIFDAFHRHTRAGSIPELLVKAWLCAGMATDVLALLGERLGPGEVAMMEELLSSQRQVSWFAEQHLGGWIETDQEMAGRLSLFGRRVVGEASAQAQRLVALQAPLMAAITGHEPGSVAEVRASTQLIADLVEASAARMIALGLQP